MGTIGKIALAGVGGAIGFATGGLGFVLMGAVIGYGIGEMIDPTAPDVSSIGEPEVADFEVPKANEGAVLADALGTQADFGNILWYGYARSKEIKEKVKTGKGGGKKKKVTVGYKYYLTWAQGICLGPIDELISVFRYEDPVWYGSITMDDVAADGTAQLTLQGMGSMTIYMGTNTHTANSRIGADVGATLNPSYRGLCWAFFDDVEIGDYNRMPPMKFVYRKTPTFSWNLQNRVGAYDYNPAHAIYYILTEMLGLSDTWVNETSFSDVADTLMLESELRGISILFKQHRSAMSYIESILTHIGGKFYYGTDGKWNLGLIRDDVDLVDMIELTDDDMLEPLKLSPGTYLDTINDVKMQYSMRFDGPNPAPGYPDVYAFSFIDESISNTTPNYNYTISASNLNASPKWLSDVARWQAQNFERIKPGSSIRGLCIHTEKSTGYKTVVPTDADFDTDVKPWGCYYVQQPYTSPNWETILKDQFLNNMIPSRGYMPGSWFIFNVDSSSTEQSVVDNCWDMIDDFRDWLAANDYQYNYYGSSGMQGGEHWLTWIMDEFAG